MRTTLITVLAVAALSPLGLLAEKESAATDRLAAATDVVRDMTHEGDKGIPQDLLNRAKCVVVIPNMKKAGFIFGAKYGRGFATCRKQGGMGWSAPAAMQIEGGSWGLQIGASESDVILLVMNDGGMKHLLQDKFTLGGDASVAAGPVGRSASAQTDAEMHAEMLSYSRTRGLFAGLVLEGATLHPDHDSDRELYGHNVTSKEILTGEVKAPPAAEQFMHELDRTSMTRNR